MFSANEKWVSRLGSAGARLRLRYIYLRFLLLVWVFAVLAILLPRWPTPAWFYTPTTIVIVLVVGVSVPLLIIGAQIRSRRPLVAEVLRNARLPEMPVSDRSLWTLAGYDDFIRRVGSLAHEDQ